ncbi:MAG TPA: V-type ATPase subunit, partial [Longimicrobiales bacterium]|nr:V-type ATPase subunit [Longimicrobiales bacterium]
IRDTLDEENLRTALARARSPRGQGEPPFLAGGRWLEKEAFGAAIGAEDPGAVREILAGALAHTPLGAALGSLEDRTLEEAVLDTRIARIAEDARLRPGGAGPVLHFVLRLRREVRALRRLTWAVELGAPVEERDGAGRAA